MTPLVGGGTCVGGDVNGDGINLGGSISVVNGVSCSMGGRCSVCGRNESRGIERGSQLVKSSRSLVIAVSCSWQIVAVVVVFEWLHQNEIGFHMLGEHEEVVAASGANQEPDHVISVKFADGFVHYVELL